MPRKSKPPAYCFHKASGQAVVYLKRRACYLGLYGSPESHEAYARVIADWPPIPQLESMAVPLDSSTVASTINELLVRYFTFARTYYVDQSGRATSEYDNMRYAAKPLRTLFGSLHTSDFGPRALKTVRQHMVNEGRLCRQVINRRINRIRRIFKWAVAEELVPAGTYQALQAVAPLKFGRTAVREALPIKPVPQSDVDAVLGYVSPPVAAMIRLQLLGGMRPQDIVQMRPCDIDMSGTVWVYMPPQHKNRWRGDVRKVFLGPQAQQTLRPFIEREPTEYLFSPRDAEVMRNSVRRQNRKTPMAPSQAKRRPKAQPKRAKRVSYDVHSYRRAICYGIKKVNDLRKIAGEAPIAAWTPLQLRHSRATEIRKQFGLEAAQLILGQKRADVTQVYAERDETRALLIAREVG